MNALIRDNISAMNGYVPGEQPKEVKVVKLNTNESPYPPSPKVAEAITKIVATDRLRKYPDPLGSEFRHSAARVLNVPAENIIIGNGSDDILTIITRAAVGEGGTIVSPTPSYILYKTLADIQGANFVQVPFSNSWELPDPWPHPEAQLTFVPNPNSPSGTVVSLKSLRKLAQQLTGLLVIDEAYVDFAKESALSLLDLPNVVITRTMSKSYGLAGLRFGFGIADGELISQFQKVKDSYNCDVLSIAGATAAIEDQQYLQRTIQSINQTKIRLSKEMIELGFDVTPSETNFVWCRRSDIPLKPIYEELKALGILVRYMRYDGYGDGLRVSVGTDEEIDYFVSHLKHVMGRELVQQR